ncbi:unnamed protein product [Adineta ricciae]|uniref:Uncharacterized protein n=1 Tax=Adineta ricciae TaxID=249248 RepID=A0A814WCP6_ADIRI|nr:unnamed protein product [Adineta ricciae]CAF1200608.1 unnamed protein product [Adineta ricciae]
MSYNYDDECADEEGAEKIRQTETFCSGSKINCSQIGSHDTLNDHLTTCFCQSLRSTLVELSTKNEQLKQRMNAQQAEIDSLKDQLSSLLNKKPNSELSSSEKSSCNNCRDCLYLSAAGCNPAGYYHIYAYNHTTYKFDDKGEKHGVSISYCKCRCHK